MKKGWEYKKLGEVADVIHGKNQKEVLSINGAYPIYGSGGNVMGYASDYLCEAGTTILGRKGSINNPLYITERFWNVDTAFGISAKEGYDGKFLYYFITTVDWLKKNTGTTLPSLTQQVVKSVIIPIPPLSEQQSIVNYLDSAFAKIDAMKANAEKALNEAKALFQASLKEMLEPQKEWEEKKFGKICDFVRGPFGGSLKKECFKDSGYVVYEQQNAIYNKFTFRYFINEEKYNSLIRFKVNSGDLIMSCSGTIGKVAIIPENFKEGIINQALLKLTPNKDVDAHFLKYLMESNYFKEIINANIEGVAIKNIASVAVLKEIKLYVPKVSEQQKIVIEIDSLKSKVDSLQANYEKISQECDALKQAILRQVFE